MNSRFTKSFYKIREVADILGVAQSTLRFWETQFSELTPRRSSTNQRFYTPKDIETLEIIKYLLHDKGLKIEAAKLQLQHNRKNISKRIQVIDKLEKTKAELTVLLESLNLRAQKLGLEP